MNLAFLIGRFPPHDVGGAERQAERLAGLLAARGHDVTVVTRQWPGRARRETRDGFRIERVPVALAGPPRTALDLVGTLAALRALKPRPDAVLCFQTFASGFVGGVADLTLGLPCVVWVRGENEYRFDRRPHFLLPARFAWGRARRVLVQSEEHRARLLDSLRARDVLAAEQLAPRLDVLGNGVDVPERPARTGDDWLYVGRLIRNKGVDVLLEALARVRGTASDAPLWILGDGPERTALAAKAKSLGVDARFEGFQSRDRLPAYYEKARAIVLPSLEGEGLPNALLEAMAHGLPAVATELPGVHELVLGAGPIVPPGDPGALATALRSLEDPAERRRAAFVARQRALERSWEAIVPRLESVLAEAALPAPRVWIVSPHPVSRGGVAAVARQLVASPLARRYRLSVLSTYRAGSILGRLYHATLGIGAIAVRLAVRPPDLVHLKIASRGSFARKVIVAGLARMRGVPVLAHVHGGGFDKFVSGSAPPVRALARWLIEGSPHVLSLSESWANRLRQLFPEARIEALPNPVEVARFEDLARARFQTFHESAAPGRTPTALFLGDLLERKGVFDLVHAWPSVERAVPGARLVLAGAGDTAAVLAAAQAAAKATGVEGRVSVPGWVGPDEKHRLLGEAHVFVLPSYFEGVPISLLEAMAAGLPSIVTPVGGVLDAVTDGQEAIVIRPGDRLALATALVHVLTSPALARALGGSARVRAQAFDLPAFADSLDAVYRKLLARDRTGAGARAAEKNAGEKNGEKKNALEATRWA